MAKIVDAKDEMPFLKILPRFIKFDKISHV